MFVPEGDAGGWCSYMPSLVRCIVYMLGENPDAYDGGDEYIRIAELGCGPTSSSYLASLGQPFQVYAWEESEEWFPKNLASLDYHPYFGAPDEPVLLTRFHVVLVDHGVDARTRDLAILAKSSRCGLVVVHDWDVPVYNYDRIIPLFKHRVEDRSKWPYTAILSNTVDLSSWKGYVAT
jgi:hypothetical protein